MKGNPVKTKKLSLRASRRITVGAVLAALMLSPCVSWSAIGGSDFAAANSASALSTVAQSDLMLVGPVDAVDFKAGSLQSLGQVIHLPSSKGSPLRIRPGSVVEVRGRLSGPGEIQATSVLMVSKTYVAGAQNVLVRGLVTSVRADVGQLTIGKLVVDYTGALYSLDPASVSVGSQFLAGGIQPLVQGVFVALSAIGGSDAKAIGGSDVNAIGGSDLKAIGGSDLQAIGGSDLKAIGGSDVNAIGGSDLKAIGGSDLQAIGGSDLKAIGGSDLQAIGGSDLKAIGGSDLKAIGGSDLKAIGGSDLQAIGGSDLKAIGGSDLSAIGGSDSY
jgi:hypothetical protein